MFYYINYKKYNRLTPSPQKAKLWMNIVALYYACNLSVHSGGQGFMDSRIQGSWIQGQLWLHNEMLSQKSKQNRSLQKKKKLHMSLPFAVIQDYINC